jgi:hypothetical protein
LTEKGIDEGAARYLVNRYSQERLMNNIDLFNHILKTSPQTVNKNPAGWLRRAIEQDYAAAGQHQDFQTRQQKAAREAAQKQRLAVQQKRLDVQSREQRALLQQQTLARRKRLEMLRERYHSTAKEDKIWADILNGVKTKISTNAFNLYLSRTHLLSLRGEQAVVTVPNDFIRAGVTERWAVELAQALAEKVNRQRMTLQFLTLDETEGG